MSTTPIAGDRFQGRRIRCGAIGVGRMGRHHARVYATQPDCELVGVVDGDPEKRAAIAEKHQCKAFSRVEELLEAGIDAASIAVPTVHHRDVAEKLLKAGVACLVEKPLAESASAARAMKELAEKRSGILMVGHIERFNPIMRAMQASTANGMEIVPRFIQVHRVSPMTFRSVDVGVVMDMMIHDLDVVLMLMGGREPDRIRAAGVSVITDHDDICNAWLEWDMPEARGGGKCVANISASRLAFKTERVMRITGENGYIKIDYATKQGTIIRRRANEIQMEQIREAIRKGADLTTLNWHELVNVEPLVVDDQEPIVAEIRAFIEAVKTGQRPPIDAEAGFANVRTAERIVKAARENAGGKMDAMAALSAAMSTAPGR